MGAVVRRQHFQTAFCFLFTSISNRVINAELRQPKSDRGQAAVSVLPRRNLFLPSQIDKVSIRPWLRLSLNLFA